MAEVQECVWKWCLLFGCGEIEGDGDLMRVFIGCVCVFLFIFFGMSDFVGHGVAEKVEKVEQIKVLLLYKRF